MYLLHGFRFLICKQEIVTTNVLGCMYATQAVIPFMKEKREGAIVFIASDFAQVSTAYLTECLHPL